jgi:hypothetical protein
MMVRWLPKGEVQRDSIRLSWYGKALQQFEWDLKEALEQIKAFPESSRMLELGARRSDFEG